MHKVRRGHHEEIDLYDDIAKIKEALSEATQDVKGKATEFFTQSIEDVRDKSAMVHDNITDYVAEKPLKALGLAMLAGMVIGYFMRK